MNLGVVDTVNGRRMKAKGSTWAGKATAGERAGERARERERHWYGWHKDEASECVWLLLLLPQEKEAAGGGRSKGSLSMWEGHGTGDRLRVLTASVKRARPAGSANRACHLKFNNILIIFWISKLGETPALVSV